MTTDNNFDQVAEPTQTTNPTEVPSALDEPKVGRTGTPGPSADPAFVFRPQSEELRKLVRPPRANEQPVGTPPERYITLYEFVQLHQKDYSFALLGGFVHTQEVAGKLTGKDSDWLAALAAFQNQTVATHRPGTVGGTSQGPRTFYGPNPNL